MSKVFTFEFDHRLREVLVESEGKTVAQANISISWPDGLTVPDVPTAYFRIDSSADCLIVSASPENGGVFSPHEGIQGNKRLHESVSKMGDDLHNIGVQ